MDDLQQIKTWLGTGSLNIFGRPFAGKDTQGEILANMLNAPLLGGGEIMRSYHDQDRLGKIMASGDLVPNDLYLEIVVPYLSRAEYNQSPLILSAVGRSKGEGPIITEAATKSGHPIKAVILLELDEAEVWHRYEVSQQKHDRDERQDDHADILKNRLQKFREKTLPVIEYYRQQNLLISVDGMLSEEQVTAEIINQLKQLSVL